MIPADFDFQAREPEATLAGVVSTIWYARGRAPHERERILPSAGAVLLVILGPPLRMTEPQEGAVPTEITGTWLTGPHERPIMNEPTDETYVVGATFRPGGISAFLDRPADKISNRIVRVEAVAPRLDPAGTLRGTLAGSGASDAIRALANQLTESMSLDEEAKRWLGAIAALASPDLESVGDLQTSFGVSRRYFATQVRRRAGLLPKTIHRIARLRRLLDELDTRKPLAWSRQILGAGFFDQPHAIREFKTFTGMTPTEYVERRRLVWGHEIEPGEAANFVPELIR